MADKAFVWVRDAGVSGKSGGNEYLKFEANINFGLFFGKRLQPLV